MTITDLRLNGEPGIWLSAPLGACVLKSLQELDLTRGYVLELEGTAELATAESAALRHANRQLRVSLENTQDGLILQTEQTKAEQKKTRKVKRRGIISGVVIGLAGAGLGIVAGVLIAQ